MQETVNWHSALTFLLPTAHSCCLSELVSDSIYPREVSFVFFILSRNILRFAPRLLFQKPLGKQNHIIFPIPRQHGYHFPISVFILNSILYFKHLHTFQIFLFAMSFCHTHTRYKRMPFSDAQIKNSLLSVVKSRLTPKKILEPRREAG